MIDGKNFFDQSIKNDIKTYDNIPKIKTGQGDDYTIRYWLDYNYFKKHYNTIAIYLSKHQVLDADQKQYNKLVSLKI